MIQLSSAGKRFGPKLLFENLNWLITPKERAGLVGANGTGKSTLLKALAGLETLDYGKLTSTKGISAGYLPQDGLTLSGRSVFAECMSVFADLRDMEQEMEDLTRRMSELDPAGQSGRELLDRPANSGIHLVRRGERKEHAHRRGIGVIGHQGSSLREPRYTDVGPKWNEVGRSSKVC